MEIDIYSRRSSTSVTPPPPSLLADRQSQLEFYCELFRTDELAITRYPRRLCRRVRRCVIPLCVALHFSSQIAEEEEVEKKEEILDIHFYTSLNVKKNRIYINSKLIEMSQKPPTDQNLTKTFKN